MNEPNDTLEFSLGKWKGKATGRFGVIATSLIALGMIAAIIVIRLF